ncbi:hypothetical protein MKZ38_005173 [Zalerion maritima]|uniref:Uncharacterized protein n=1 Tax=Zalerion maritima TaxID=339359 RepID=A0AAD5S421_9PEZI|nr:hypothetical protein MKZ38_005173 [Zalerion maritima]
MSEPLLPPPGETLQVPTPVAYTPAPSSIGQWSDVALTTQYPSATSSSESASATIYGTTAGPWGPPPAWTTQEQMQMQPGNPFPSSPSMSSASFSPSLASTASPSMLNAQLMEHSHMQHVPKLLEAHNMIPQQFLPQGPSSAAVQGGDPTQFSLPWDMGGQLQWASTSALQAPMSDLSGIPVAPTKLNGELVHIFVKLLSRFKSSLDGNPDASNPYAKHYVPWCLSSQLLAHVALYTSACFLSETKNLDQMVATSLKGQAIGMLNEHLTGENRASDEVIAAVMQLILDEWYWGERQDLTAHLRGLRDMISLRGGIGALGLNGLLGKLVFSADRAISLSLESHPFLSASGSSLNLGDMASAPFRVPHNTPILPGQVTFAACADAVDLHVVTASILDDIRFLINTVLKLPHSPSKQEAKKLEATAKWIHNKISSLPPLSPFGGDPAAKNEDLANIPGQSQQNFLHQAIRLTSLIYTSAILQHRPLSQSCTTSQFLEIWTTAWRIPLTAWKGMLGVFLWLVFALVPTATKTEHSRFVKSMLTIACTQLGIENWAIAEPAMERMHMLQRWLSGSQHLNDTLQATSSGSAGPSGQTPPP